MAYDAIIPAGGGRDSIVSTGSDRVRAVSVGVPGASGVIISTGAVLLGWSLRETSGSAGASFDIYDGRDATGSLLGSSAMAAGGESQRDAFDEGIDAPTGVFFSLASGAVKGVVYIRADIGPGA